VDTPNNTDELETLDADMLPSDLVDALRRLKFPGNRKVAVRIDRHARDYLVASVAARCGNGK
jgi:hypothetical protein